MDLTNALATAERNVLAAFQRCIALPGATGARWMLSTSNSNLCAQPSGRPRPMAGALRCSNLPPAFSTTLQRKARSMGEIALETTRQERPKKKKAVAAVLEKEPAAPARPSIPKAGSKAAARSAENVAAAAA